MKQEDNFTPLDNDVIHKEIDIIQGIINRMGQNSFFIKGWAVALVVGFSTFIFNKEGIPLNNGCLIILGESFIIVILWYLDSFFLYTERFYRLWYDFHIVKRRHYKRELKYLLNINDIKTIMREEALEEFKLLPNKREVFFSETLLFFYIAILIYSFIVFFIYCFI